MNFQVSKFKDPRDACAAVVAESYRLWLQYETRTDDITIIVVHINGIMEVGFFSYYPLSTYALSCQCTESSFAPNITGTFLLDGICSRWTESADKTFAANCRSGRI